MRSFFCVRSATEREGERGELSLSLIYGTHAHTQHAHPKFMVKERIGRGK